MLGQKAETHDEGLLQGGQAVLLLARIDNIEEDGGARGRSRESVLNGCVGRVKLWGDGIGGDVLVMRWERVSRQAERADPEAGAHINLARKLVR